jgi:hypothetical protein
MNPYVHMIYAGYIHEIMVGSDMGKAFYNQQHDQQGKGYSHRVLKATLGAEKLR